MKKIFITISAIILTACTVFESDHDNYWLNNIRSFKTLKINYYDPSGEKQHLTSSKILNTRIYKRNVLVSANLGQRMIDAQTYTVNQYANNKVKATNSGTIYAMNEKIFINKGDVFKPFGEVKMNGSYYQLIDPKHDGQILLIDENGHILNMVCMLHKGELLLPREKALIQPETIIVAPDDSIEEASTPKLQFEIKYDGFENDMRAFIYTDYSNANSTEGYFQRYVFPKEQDLIDINGIKFKIMDAYPERIEYIILD